MCSEECNTSAHRCCTVQPPGHINHGHLNSLYLFSPLLFFCKHFIVKGHYDWSHWGCGSVDLFLTEGLMFDIKLKCNIQK